ncbi:phosphate acetyltransferase [Colwellia psychrerythraea]|uniref:Phosphate acetyltransferase n=1 Tax=Colwellia psychrerythraea TaxID=28229 RepID=A0A099KBE4_COLPS|nr:phosphate acetyltransferase [Colwellia psychrerythraea]KGJ87397.1 phosphate acetyltransferase [Colwellia psychrerythraea]
MPHRIMLIPVGSGVGLTSVSLGLLHACQQKGIKVGHFKPISQPSRNSLAKKNKTIDAISLSQNSTSISLSYVEGKMGDGLHDVVLEEIVANFDDFKQDHDVVIIEGLVPTPRQPYAGRINRDVAQALSANIVLVASPGNDSAEEFEDRLEVSAATYGGIKNKHLIGCVINKLNCPDQEEYGLLPKEEEIESDFHLKHWLDLAIFKNRHFDLLGTIMWDIDLIAPRICDISNYLGAKVLNEGAMAHRRFRSVAFCARTVSNLVSYLVPGRLIVTPGDRTDIIIATCLSALNGTKLGGLILTNGFEPSEQVWELCKQALDAGLPVLSVPWDTWQTSRHIMGFNPEIPQDDIQRHEKVKQHIADNLSLGWLESLTSKNNSYNLFSPPAFRHKLTELARQANKLVVLPEGTDIRTIKAAAICCERNIARCQLIGNKEEILQIAEHQGIHLPDNLLITDPETIRDNYVRPMVELRKHKGLTNVVALENLKDNVVLATMMLQLGQVDGLVSGAVNTTANTIRPALQLIKTAPDSSLVSSVFFMLLPDQVLVYGDCAINPEPSAEQLADIAIQSADSAKAFDIQPRVAMISYSTGSSGHGADVEKVAKATEIAKAKRPDLIIDGPLQYDAAIMESVAKKKAPNSPVAGKATVFIFPDLNTGNTTYKAVQRSADLVSIGPMLQGMNKPVNDLSRGALVDDIVYTIALTAIQATQ